MTIAKVSQQAVEIAHSDPVIPAARITQQAVEVVHNDPVIPAARITQQAVEITFSSPIIPKARITQQAVEVMYTVHPLSPPNKKHFKTGKGIELYGNATILSGILTPGATTDTNNAQVGSMYLRTDGVAYTKTSAGSGYLTWTPIKLTALPYDLAFFIPPTPLATNNVVTGFLSPRDIRIIDSSPHMAKCSTPATTDVTVFDIKINGNIVASVTFAVGATLGTIAFIIGSTISIAAGDEVTVCTTDVIDSTITSIGITLIGTSTLT